MPLLLVALALLQITPALAQEEREPKFYLELRPLQFLMNGYSVVGHYALSDRMQLGVNVFAATLSERVTDLIWSTQGNIDLEAQQDIVLALSFRYFLVDAKGTSGWFVGAAAGVENYTLTDQERNEALDYRFYYVAPRIGYLWHPFKSKLPNLFVVGEAVAVFPLIGDGEVTFSSGSRASINAVLPSPLIGMGYRF